VNFKTGDIRVQPGEPEDCPDVVHAVNIRTEEKASFPYASKNRVDAVSPVQGIELIPIERLFCYAA